MHLKELPVSRDLASRPQALARYLEMVASGQSPRMAECLAMQQAPGIGVTNTQYLQDQRRWGNSILDRMNGNQRAVSRLRDDLARHGYRLRDDDHYISGAARFAGDPEAIVNEHSTFDELQKRVDERVKRSKDNPPERVRLHPRLVENIRRRRISQNPDLAYSDQDELRAEIIETHGSKP